MGKKTCRRAALSIGLALALVAAAPGWSVGAASAAPVPLAEAVTRALTQGADARIATLETARADDALTAARSAYLPHASVSSRAGYSNRQDEKLRTIDGDGRERRYGLSSLASDTGWLNLYVDQLIFDLRTWRGVERAALSAEASRIAEAEQREAIGFDVARRYVDALRLDALVELDTRRLAQAERLDGQAASLLAGGRVLASAREHAALALEAVRVEGEARVAERRDAHDALARAMGDPAAAGTLTLVPTSLAAVVEGSEDPDLAAVLAGAPELQLLRLRTRMEDVSVAAARAERYPTVGLRAGYFNYGVKRFDNFEDEVRVGVDLQVPLFDGLKARSSVAGAVKSAAIARLRYESVREAKRARVRDLRRQLETARRQPALAARQAIIAEERLRLADVRLQGDRGSLDEALTAREQWGRDARVAIDTRFDAVVLWATLQREAGRLTAAITGPGAGDEHAAAEVSGDTE
jgi:outer membrane protein TolC